MPKFKNASPQTKSFIILLACAVVGTYLSFWVAANYQNTIKYPSSEYKAISYNESNLNLINQTLAAEPEPVVDTSAWKRFEQKTFGFSFLYNPDWKIGEIKKQNGYDVLEIDPGVRYYNIKIYISPSDFYVMGGLPDKEVQIAGQNALDVADLLYGLKANGYYYTFDNGQSVSLKPQFKALVSSLKFE